MFTSDGRPVSSLLLKIKRRDSVWLPALAAESDVVKDGPTDMGGKVYSFPATSWTAIVSANSPSSPEARQQLERLCARYWKPVYAHVRWRWSKSNEDSKDLTQAFFAWFLERGALERAEEGRGRFRSYLRVCLDNFLKNAEAAGRAIVRGGQVTHVPIDFEDGTLPLVAPSEPGPRDFDQQWAASLLQDSIQVLRDRYGTEGKRDHFLAFELYYLGEDQPTYGDIAKSLRVKPSKVQNFLKHARAALRGIVRSRVRETVGNLTDLDDEIRAIFQQGLGL